MDLYIPEQAIENAILTESEPDGSNEAMPLAEVVPWKSGQRAQRVDPEGQNAGGSGAETSANKDASGEAKTPAKDKKAGNTDG